MAINVRNPGSLPNVFARVERARAMLADSKLDKDVREAVEALIALASTQHELNKRLWEAIRGLPFGVLDALAEAGVDLSGGDDTPGIGGPLAPATPSLHLHRIDEIRGAIGDVSLILAGQVFGP